MQFHVAREKKYVELRVKTPHGAVVLGASVRVTDSTGTLEVQEGMPGRYRFRSPRESKLTVAIDAPNNRFECQTFRGILHTSASNEQCVLVGGSSPEFVRDESVLQTHTAQNLMRGIGDKKCQVFDVAVRCD